MCGYDLLGAVQDTPFRDGNRDRLIGLLTERYSVESSLVPLCLPFYPFDSYSCCAASPGC